MSVRGIEKTMTFPRSSGILLHPTSLPGRYGIGELGAEAHRFAGFLRDAGQKIWQVLPLGPTGFGDSPYQCFSAFAGNPLLLSLDVLVERGYLKPSDLESRPLFPADHVDFDAVIEWKLPLLRKAYEGFAASGADRDAYDAFCHEHALWLDDYALFMSLKQVHKEGMWTLWEPPYALRDAAALEQAGRDLRDDIECQKFIQFEFQRQWSELKAHCVRDGIRLMGDVPIYVALDSSDVWAHPEMFELLPDGQPRVIAGVPPDYFSATGQCWGNPIYRWEQHAKEGFLWWIARFRRSLEMLDLIRLDHFRGFEAYWEIPGGATTAVNGRWVKGPGAALFEALEGTLGRLPVVAENLGVITPEVEALRNQFGFPGMAILQFAFGKDPQAPDFKPHNYPHHLVAYTGTHDNDTVMGWWHSTGAADSTRTAEDVSEEMEFARRYLNTDGSQINWVMIRTLMASVADTVLFPLQDVLGVGSEGRMNLPGTASGNWRWRFRSGELLPSLAERLKRMVETYDR
jgi:4-alpha-glucanotransferase